MCINTIMLNQGTFIVADDSVKDFVANQDAILIRWRRGIPEHKDALWRHGHRVHVLRRLTRY